MKIEIEDQDANYMYDIIQRIIDEAGCRMPCSPQEAKGAEIIKKEMEQTCDEVEIEPFTCHPRAFLGWIKIDIILILVSMGCFFLIGVYTDYLMRLLLSLISFGLSFTAFLILWNEFFNYREFIDPLFKKKSSQNVVGKIKPSGEPKNIIIYSGHHDSALQFNLLRYLKIGYGIIIFWGMIIMFIWIIRSGIILIITAFSIDFYQYFLERTIWTLIIGAVPLIGLFFFVSPGEKANKVPGAVDNLSAVSIVLGVGRYLKKHPDLIPPNTEVRLISFGCEEAGLRGAYRYAEAHLKELQEKNAEVVNMDGIQSVKKPLIIENEPTTRTKHSPEVVDKLIEASKTVEVEAEVFGNTFTQQLIGQISGGTDATAFSKAGIKAATIASMELKKFIKFYHQPTDTVDMIDKGALEKVLKLCLGYLINEGNA